MKERVGGADGRSDTCESRAGEKEGKAKAVRRERGGRKEVKSKEIKGEHLSLVGSQAFSTLQNRNIPVSLEAQTSQSTVRNSW